MAVRDHGASSVLGPSPEGPRAEGLDLEKEVAPAPSVAHQGPGGDGDATSLHPLPLGLPVLGSSRAACPHLLYTLPTGMWTEQRA